MTMTHTTRRWLEENADTLKGKIIAVHWEDIAHNLTLGKQ